MRVSSRSRINVFRRWNGVWCRRGGAASDLPEDELEIAAAKVLDAGVAGTEGSSSDVDMGFGSNRFWRVALPGGVILLASCVTIEGMGLDKIEVGDGEGLYGCEDLLGVCARVAASISSTSD